MTTAEYEEQRARYAASFEERLSAIAGTWNYPAPLAESMRYSLFSGGKRIRPVLLLASCEAVGGTLSDTAYLFAAAVESLHTYSLVHDDLPCMDDDDFRRGMPTSHKKFGEDIAVLTGDALLNKAYELVFEAIKASGYNVNACLAGERFASLTGAAGLIGGQVADLSFSGGTDELSFVFEHKTCDLIVAAATCGALLSGADEKSLAAAKDYAYNFGFAFQLADDLLDKKADEGCSVLRITDEATAKKMLSSYTERAIVAARTLENGEFLAMTAALAEKRTK